MLPVSVTAASYTDYARVVATEPLYERVRVSLPAEDCSRGDDRRPTGWVSPERFGGSLAEHLRFEIASRREASAAARCSKWTEQQEIERVRGYRVWYEYRGQTLVQELPAPPGPRIPVVVDLEPE